MKTKQNILERFNEIASINETQGTKYETRISISPTSGINVTHNLNPDPFGKFSASIFDTDKHLDKFYSKSNGKENVKKIKPIINKIESKVIKELEKAQDVYVNQYKKILKKYADEMNQELEKLKNKK